MNLQTAAMYLRSPFKILSAGFNRLMVTKRMAGQLRIEGYYNLEINGHSKSLFLSSMKRVAQNLSFNVNYVKKKLGPLTSRSGPAES